MEKFETDLKLRFSEPDQTYYIKFGRDRDVNAKAGILRGRIALKGCVPSILSLTLEVAQ
jgi:hypothetical protein